jgi:hypothetical protein
MESSVRVGYFLVRPRVVAIAALVFANTED